MRSNKGLSYIELILVISIITILSGLTAIGLGVINRNNVNKTVEILDSAFSRAQSLSMSKGQNNGCITLMVDNGKYYYYFGNDSSNKVLLANSPINITLLDASGNQLTDSGGNAVNITYSGVTFYFKTNTGALDYPATVPSGYHNACEALKIQITNGGTRTVTLKLSKLTGKTEIE